MNESFTKSFVVGVVLGPFEDDVIVDDPICIINKSLVRKHCAFDLGSVDFSCPAMFKELFSYIGHERSKSVVFSNHDVFGAFDPVGDSEIAEG